MTGLLGNVRILAAIYSLNHLSPIETQKLIQQLNQLEIKNPIKLDPLNMTQNDALLLLNATPQSPPPHFIVKIADTSAEISEGRRAGVWTIAWTYPNMPFSENEAHFSIKSLSELTKIIETINTCLRIGKIPENFNTSSLVNFNF